MIIMEIFVDGSGKGKYGFVSGNTVMFYDKVDLTVNQAEYTAIIKALEWVIDKDVIILSDSQLAVRQLNHEYHIKDDKLRQLALTVWKIIVEKSLNVEFRWIPRKMNKAGKLVG
jgi:ribonuclease HI